MNNDRNVIFTAVCTALNVTAKFEKSGQGKRPAVSTGGLAGAYAHLLCNPKNIPLVNALIDKGIQGDWFKAPALYGNNANYRAFLYAAGTSVRDVRGKGHISADSVTGKVTQDAVWIAYCQAYATQLVADKASGIAQSIREGRVNGAIPDQVQKASLQLSVRDAIQEHKAPVPKLIKALESDAPQSAIAKAIMASNKPVRVKKPVSPASDKPAASKGKKSARAA
jgi:hypothetical protein